MDIWKWVFDTERDLRESGNHRLADLVDTIPDNTRADRPELVVAAMPEALAGARALKNPWLEVYFRHWGINNRMSDLIEGEKALPEIVSLLEFSHREETITCPQSVCATQDIAMCYGNMDGPGYVTERLAVATEALARINPEWPCFSCISEEYVLALLDAERSTEALQFLHQQEQAMLNVGEESPDRFVKLFIRALCQEGKYSEAMTKLDTFEARDDRDLTIGEKISLHISRAILLAQKQEYEQAWETLPSWNNIKPTAYPEWAQAMLTIATGHQPYNTWHIGRVLQKSIDYLSSVGAHFHTVNTAIAHIELALTRGVHWSAQRAMVVAQKHLLKLRKPELLAAKLDALNLRIQATPAETSLPVPADALVEYIRNQENSDPEHDVQHLLQACTLRPDDGDLVGLTASALAACGASDEANDILLKFIRANPTVDGPNYQLVGRLLDAQNYTDIEAIAKEIEKANPSAAIWFRAQQCFAQQQYQAACDHAAAYVALNQEAKGARDLWASAALMQGDVASALKLRQTLVELSEPDSEELTNHQWALLTVASAAQDWPEVRKTAAALGFTIEDEEDETDAVENKSGIIEQDWGAVYIEFKDQLNTETHFAYRTGPATARILTHKNAPDMQHLGDWVAFDTALVEPMPEDEAEREDFIRTYRAAHVIQLGGFSHSVFCDGAYPGEEAFEQFNQTLLEKGWRLTITSDEGYTVANPHSCDDEDTLAGCYFQVAAPVALKPKEINEALLKLTADWPYPICWARFAQREGFDFARHQKVIDDYDL
ncbi:MAG: hypothetical protein WBP13_05855 [Methylophilaceae bacterium]